MQKHKIRAEFTYFLYFGRETRSFDTVKIYQNMDFLWPVFFLFYPFFLNAPFLYPLKTSENCNIFWCFQVLEKGCIGKEWVKDRIFDSAFIWENIGQKKPALWQILCIVKFL